MNIGCASKPVAGDDVKHRDGQKAEAGGKENHIEQDQSPELWSVDRGNWKKDRAGCI
jgi:hypothetical protein